LPILFKDRFEAGIKMAELLSRENLLHPLILAVPRGGIPVAREVAMALGAPLSVFIARKLGAPCQPEFGIGAIAEGGGHVLDQASIDCLGITKHQIEDLLEQESQRLKHYVDFFRNGKPLPDVKGRCVVLVDDGLATGVTVQAAVFAVRRLLPARIVVAAPVASSQAARALQSVADLVLTVSQPDDFRAVGQYYRDFEQLPDTSLLQLLDG
jgi:putative phosphoribosyl transferase